MSDPTKASWIVRAGGEPTDGAVSALAKLLLANIDEIKKEKEKAGVAIAGPVS